MAADLACEDIILHKLAAGRLIDRADIIALVRANSRTLDLDYLAKWSDELRLTPAWREIFPDSPPPRREDAQ